HHVHRGARPPSGVERQGKRQVLRQKHVADSAVKLSMMFDLSGTVAVVTRGSRGIGRSICEQMDAHGAKVVVSSRKLPACEEVVKGIKAKGAEATAVPASISDKAQLENLVATARKTYGKVDIMVC